MTINRPSISGITVEPVTRQGAYFHKKLALDNSSRADVEEIAVVGVKAGAGTNGTDIVSAYSGVVWAVQSPERFTYDEDGNQLSDALRRYEWDAENRLIAVTSSNVVDGSLARVEFTYDYMSRRISKTVFNWLSNGWSKIENRKFIYDGWNMIKELSTTEDISTGLPASRVIDYYVWGLDLSGSLQGAGGIGGLLGRVRKEERFFDDRGLLLICHRPPGNPENYQTIRINASAWPAHEAHGDTLGSCAGATVSSFLYTFDGNGNVSELLNPKSAIENRQFIVAHYEYSPFGETIVATGPEAFDNPFRFSTKYFVDELGIGDWGRRWYLPPLGRWLSRDPIEDKLNNNKFVLPRIMRKYHIKWEGSPYAFVENNPLTYNDFLGLCLINYTCTLTSQSANGICDKNCNYSCIETSRRDLPYGPGTPCMDVPEPYKFTTTKVARGFTIMSICCSKGQCKDPFSDVVNVGGAGGLDCSKSACLNNCDKAATAAKLACRFTPNPIACRLAVQLAKELCDAGCALCDKP